MYSDSVAEWLKLSLGLIVFQTMGVVSLLATYDGGVAFRVTLDKICHMICSLVAVHLTESTDNFTKANWSCAKNVDFFSQERCYIPLSIACVCSV